MNLYLPSSTTRVATPELNDSPSLLMKLLKTLARRTSATVLLITALAPAARAQSTVTLAWDPSPGGAIAGYRLYDGPASRTYTNVLDVGSATTATVSNLIRGTTYFFAATAYDTNGLESDYSSEVSYTVPLLTIAPPTIVLTTPIDGAVYAAPATLNLAATVAANGHTINQVQFYSGATVLGIATSPPYSFNWSNVSFGTYTLGAQVVYDSGGTVASAALNVAVEASRPSSGLTFAADSGTLTAPFVASNGTISQPLTTDMTNGGRALYNFEIIKAGQYLVSAMVIAPSLAQNSLYVNIDAEPTDPLMIWDIPVCSTLTSQIVSWRGNGDSDPASSQYIPKVFTLTTGMHQLIIRGREAGSTLGTIVIAAMPPKITISQAAGGRSIFTTSVQPPPLSITLSAAGQPGQTYNVLCSQDFQTWNLIGTLTLDASGLGQFTDLAAGSRPVGLYRLQEP